MTTRELIAARRVVEAAETMVREVSWYSSRKIDLARCDPDGSPWASHLERDLQPTIEALAAYDKETA